MGVAKDVVWVYGVHNRLYYNQITFPAVLAECKQSKRFAHLVIVDDMSEDGTSEFIQSFNAKKMLDGAATYCLADIGNSTGQWNIAAKKAKEIGAKYVLNICNDNLFPFGIVNGLADVLDRYPGHFLVGPRLNSKRYDKNGIITDYPYIAKKPWVELVDHVGCGMLRVAHWDKLGEITPSTIENEKRFYGFTNYQHRMRDELGHHTLTANHIKMLRLDTHPAFSRLNEYTSKGYGRNIRGKVSSVFDGN